MDDLLDMIKLEDLQGDSKDLAEIVGMSVFKKLVKYYGGSSIYVPKADWFVLPIRNKLIIHEYNGGNSFDLSRKWGMSERRILEIVKEKSDELRRSPLDGQTSLWE